MTFVPTAKDFSFRYDAERTFPFFESEDGEIFAYGHVDPQNLVAEVRNYDNLMAGEGWGTDEDYDDLIQYVKHTWAIIVDDGVDGEWRFQYGDKEGVEGAFPLTVVER